MHTIAHARKLLKRLALGPVCFPQECAVGLPDPQPDVAVWLHGIGDVCDVTNNHFMACGAPLTIGVGLDGARKQLVTRNIRPALRFVGRAGEQLGEITLQWRSTIPLGEKYLALFQIKNYSNYCLPTIRLWAHYLQYAYQQSRVQSSNVAITTREIHAMIVFYVCPRPVALVSVVHGSSANVFPMNLMGAIDSVHFCFALNSTTPVANLVEQAGQIALSSIPVEQSSTAFQFGKHHRMESIDLDQLPFATRSSVALGLPIPEFALRVREMQVESTRQLGSHTLFMARMVHDEHYSDGLGFFVEHGIYRAWREDKMRPSRLTQPSSALSNN